MPDKIAGFQGNLNCELKRKSGIQATGLRKVVVWNLYCESRILLRTVVLKKEVRRRNPALADH
jgi:hypothetical protein